MFEYENNLFEREKIRSIKGGKVSQRKSNGKWGYSCRIVRIDDTEKQIKSHRFELKRDAKKAIDYLIDLTKKSKIIDENECDYISFQEVSKEFFMDYKSKQKYSTSKTVNYFLKNHIDDFFGKKNITEISSRDVQKWKMYLNEKTLIASGKNRALSILKKIFNYAIIMEYIKDNPADKVENFGKNYQVKTIHFWTHEMFLNFLKNVDVLKYKVLFSTLFYTGMRKGELRGLTWERINFETNEIYVMQAVSDNVILPPKTKKSIRKISLPNFLVEMLQELYYIESNKIDFRKSFFVFGDDVPLSDNAIDVANRKYAKFVEDRQERITIHGYRHSHACYLLNELNWSIKAVAERLGHADVSETLNTYIHTLQNDTISMLEKIEEDFHSKKNVNQL